MSEGAVLITGAASGTGRAETVRVDGGLLSRIPGASKPEAKS
jgi:hypothetical protein